MQSPLDQQPQLIDLVQCDTQQLRGAACRAHGGSQSYGIAVAHLEPLRLLVDGDNLIACRKDGYGGTAKRPHLHLSYGSQ